jgi:NADH dehydrogenase
MRVLVTGATGYVGRTLVERLEADGHEVVRFSRGTGGDVRDRDAVGRAMDGAQAVCHLVAILDGTDAEFEAINAEGARNVVEAATAAGVRRFLLMSAAGVNEANATRTRYWGSKWQAKKAVMESGLDWTAFAPSFVFGRGGGALHEFEQLLRLPVVPVVGNGKYRHQPVWVGDVAGAFSAALARPQTIGQTYQLGGPQALAFDDLLDELARVTGRRPRPKLHAPVGLAKAQTVVLRHLPPPLRATSEQIEMLVAGTECDIGPMREELGIEPASLADAYTR